MTDKERAKKRRAAKERVFQAAMARFAFLQAGNNGWWLPREDERAYDEADHQLDAACAAAIRALKGKR